MKYGNTFNQRKSSFTIVDMGYVIILGSEEINKDYWLLS